MYSIKKIAKITLEKIYKQDSSYRAINFFDGTYDLSRVLSLFDTRTLADVEADEAAFPFPREFPKDGEIEDIDSDSIDELYVWGIRLGLKEIPMLSGSKSILDRIIEDENETGWWENVGRFSHLVLERRVAIENGYPVWEVNIYTVSKAQQKEITKKIYGFLNQNLF